jgi:hypothetical protein
MPGYLAEDDPMEIMEVNGPPDGFRTNLDWIQVKQLPLTAAGSYPFWRDIHIHRIAPPRGTPSGENP